MPKTPQSRQTRSSADELRELRDIAAREHGPNARSTRRLDEALAKELRAPRKDGKSRPG